MKIIQATVSKRLLTKADRLFTGTLDGRIIEILRNARRAEATHVAITNKNGSVTIRDNGRGIKDFATLLDLGGSNWPAEADLEASEDPAGVGLFCLSPRQVVVRSGGFIATIGMDGWTGGEVQVQSDPRTPTQPPELTGVPPLPLPLPGVGAEFSFQDEPWTLEVVKPLTVFTGMNVMVDNEPCPQERFIRGRSAHYPVLGARIAVTTVERLSEWHRQVAHIGCLGSTNVIVNFHGQVVGFNYAPVTHHALIFLVDLTGEPTCIRLMLPARTQLVENEALELLKTVLEREAFLYLLQQGSHQLPYKEYLRAKELGVELPEAEPTYTVGLFSSDMDPQPVEVVKPKDHPLDRCYRFSCLEEEGNETDEANAHLLAALGTFEQPFVPVQIRSDYDGYSWAHLPTISKLEVSAGTVLQEEWVGSGVLICVDRLRITVHTSDGKIIQSNVPMALKPWKPPEPPEGSRDWSGDDQVYVTKEAQDLNPTDVWFHLGSYRDDGDTYDTQEYHFNQELDAFWMKLSGPDEPLRVKLMEPLGNLEENWRSVTILASGCVTLHFKDGTEKAILPPRGTMSNQTEGRP